ncbi:acyl-coenzyme A thioesterase THEM4-like [Chroicocephalus ridibundus]|uniref:acyl-coenzyme A thioesterase THEM4-like n=1 Tax=Chroicocephalus ridibundus TaxID=1192867 RepID=UPI002FDD8EBB
MWQTLLALRRGVSTGRPPRGPARPLPPSPAPPEPPRDLAVPNGGWSAAMRRHYRRLLAMAAGGAWARLPSYRRARQHGAAVGGVTPPAQGTPPGDTRLFPRAIEGDGNGFEYAMFLNAAERRLLCLVQPGPYLEGHPGLTHGGAIATIIDSALGTCALAVAGPVVTANLSIDYLAPVPLGAVLLVEGRTERLEGRKVFLSCQVRDADGDTLHARATGLFIQPDPIKLRAQDGDGRQ